MTDLDELNRLYAATTQDPEAWDDGGFADGASTFGTIMSVADWRFCCAAHNAWPAVSAELFESRDVIADLRRKLAEAGVEGSPPPGGSVMQRQSARLALLEEFVRKVRVADELQKRSVDFGRAVSNTLDWLDDEEKKAGE